MAPRDALGTAEKLRQTHSTTIRSDAIVVFCKALRLGNQFQPFWDAIGGAAALADLMTEFSLRDIKTICRRLGHTASAQKARPARRAALGELVQILHGLSSGNGVPKDPRPLRQYYQDIVPACNWDVVQQWEKQYQVQWTRRQSNSLFLGHREQYEKRFLENVFSTRGTGQNMTFGQEKRLFQGNIDFTKTILERLIQDKADIVQIPGDLMSAVVMPVVTRLFLRRRYSNEMRDSFLDLVTECIQAHPRHLAKHLHLGRKTLVSYANRRWTEARDDRTTTSSTTQQQTESTLKQLIALMPTPHEKTPYKLDVIVNDLLFNRRRHVCSYQLLRLILRHANGYKLDIDDESLGGLARLRALSAQGNLWPPKLFLYLDVQDGLALFERLSSADPTGSFLRLKYGGLMNQSQDMGGSCGDVAILRCLLLKKNKGEPTNSEWISRARNMVLERRKMSQESRESPGRSFWAKAAFNLAIAIGDLELLDDTILWARRYKNEPLVLMELYTSEPFATTELCDLVSAVPYREEGVEIGHTNDITQVKKNIELSHQIIIHLMETINMTFSQPQVKIYTFKSVFTLFKMVADRRLKKESTASFHDLFDPIGPTSAYDRSPTVEVLWKPYLETLIEVEALMESAPDRHMFDAGPLYIFRRLAASGPMKADLATFLLQKMKARLSSESMRTRMSNIVSFVMEVARSDQPWLAFPFLQQIILEGQGADSTWYRQLLDFKFLASLPSSIVNEFLHMLADTFQKQMREQASKPMEVVGDDGKVVLRAPVIKVTTVKMMAQILQGTQIISPSAACNILLGLLAEARHIDIRVAIVSSLLSILKEPSTLPEIHGIILDALETHVIPVLGQLNERRPVTEDQWVAAESGEAPIPDIGDETPLMSQLGELEYGNKKLLPAETRIRLINLFTRVPAVSAANNTRWNKLFLKRHGFHLDEGEVLPACPVSPKTLRDLFRRFPTHMPASTVSVLQEMTLINLAPTPGIARVTAAVKANRDLIKSNAGKHWLMQFDNPGNKALEAYGVFVASSCLQQIPEDLASERNDEQGITVQMLQDFILATANQLIASQHTDLFDSLVTRLCSSRFVSRRNWQGWLQHSVPVLKTMISNVESLRLRVRNGEKGLTKILPKTFAIRSNLLPIPYPGTAKDAPSEIEWRNFASELVKLLEWLAERKHMPYHEEFAQLKADVRNRIKMADSTKVALLLSNREFVSAENEEELSLAGHLRIEITGFLLIHAAEHKDWKVHTDVEEVVDGWVNSNDEFVREIGFSIQKKHKEKAA